MSFALSTFPRRARLISLLATLPILASTLFATSPAAPQATKPPRLIAASNQGFYHAQRTLLPLAGEGTFSKYADTEPVLEKDARGRDVVRVPTPFANEVNLVWTFWRHKQPPQDQWPAGQKSRAALTLIAAEDYTFRPQLFVKTSTWSAPVQGPQLTLSAGQPTTIEIPLPPTLPPGPIENVRLVLSAGKAAPVLALTGLSVGEEVPIALHLPSLEAQRTRNPMRVTGLALPGSNAIVQALAADGTVRQDWSAIADASGRFILEVDRSTLPLGALQLKASATQPNGTAVEAKPISFYVYPVLKEGVTLPPITRDGRQLLLNGKPWGFAGLNYTRFLLEFSLRTNFQVVAEDLRKYGDWGIGVLRVPLHLGMFQPAPGVFPDDPRYAEILRSHKTDPDFFRLFEYFIAVAGHHGIRVVIDWHEMPTDPYRYFVGGNNHDKGTEKPGTGIAWLYDPQTKKAAEPGTPRFAQAIAETNRWLARRLKGNGNVLGFEAPYNEPHSVTDSADFTWRQLTATTIRPITIEDPDRLTFGMAPAWGHSNVLPSVTWMLPDDLSGVAPHHYHGNGPVSLRPDAKSRKEPWLARDIDAAFDHSFFAVSLPHSAAPYPVWNGESGEHGYQSFLPDMERVDSSSLMIEAQLVQAYSAGWTGSLGWTLTGNAGTYQPVVHLYEQAYRRFSPVYAAGPVDQSRAQVLFVQNPAAVPISNGLNHTCVPFAKLALDLHLAPVHYMTDDQLLSTGLVQMAVGLEQVEQAVAGFNYKAAIIDTRNLDSRAIDLIKGSKLPLLLTEDAAKLTRDEVASFLKNAGVNVDERTPSALQLIAGPQHFIVYRRSGEDAPARVFPRLPVEGRFQLVAEDGRSAYSGDAAKLATDGLEVNVAKWRSVIFRIEKL